MKNSMDVPQKPKNTSSISNSSTLVYISKENECSNLKIYMHPNIHSNITYNSKNMEVNEVSINK